ncbi:hypothetical protein QBC47DRAFT_395296 [Echria macrotheca]|uniref:Uncharacterized protein n=1 Tax=Echria macrotheca TaxID=438768 RepID=A0AAJ0F639_9PEZI|nr:hypothetical protein QBC47DRAFT_395296 [Echria macrotheca]
MAPESKGNAFSATENTETDWEVRELFARFLRNEISELLTRSPEANKWHLSAYWSYGNFPAFGNSNAWKLQFAKRLRDLHRLLALVLDPAFRLSGLEKELLWISRRQDKSFKLDRWLREKARDFISQIQTVVNFWPTVARLLGEAQQATPTSSKGGVQHVNAHMDETEDESQIMCSECPPLVSEAVAARSYGCMYNMERLWSIMSSTFCPSLSLSREAKFPYPPDQIAILQGYVQKIIDGAVTPGALADIFGGEAPGEEEAENDDERNLDDNFLHSDWPLLLEAAVREGVLETSSSSSSSLSTAEKWKKALLKDAYKEHLDLKERCRESEIWYRGWKAKMQAKEAAAAVQQCGNGLERLDIQDEGYGSSR